MFDSCTVLGRSPYIKKLADGSLRHVTDITADKAISFLEEHALQKVPFCLSISFNAPHAEDADLENHFPPPPGVASLYGKSTPEPPRLGDPSLFAVQPKFLRSSMNRTRWLWRWDKTSKFQRNMRNYWRMISGVDAAMQRVLTALKAHGFADNTVIIFSSDNGLYLGNRGFAGKWSHYDESLRVPFVISDPRSEKSHRGKVIHSPVLNVDIAPTLLALAGLEPSGPMQGKSLVPLLQGEVPPDWRTEFLAEHRFDIESIPKWEGVRGRRWVYARYYTQSPPYEFLHDLRSDPDQLKNLADSRLHSANLKTMRERCDLLLELRRGTTRHDSPVR
jgi:arylsulfatase A-like enzyme